jgi:putative membrane protein
VNIVAQVAAAVAVLVHLTAFAWETLLFRRPGVHRDIFKIPTGDVEPVRMWAFNVGIYNLLLASGTVIGLIAVNTGEETIGRAFVLYTCSFMALAGVGLGVSDRLAMSRPKGAGVVGTIAQLVPPLVAIIALTSS